jgi:hypothetical protein
MNCFQHIQSIFNGFLTLIMSNQTSKSALYIGLMLFFASSAHAGSSGNTIVVSPEGEVTSILAAIEMAKAAGFDHVTGFAGRNPYEMSLDR